MGETIAAISRLTQNHSCRKQPLRCRRASALATVSREPFISERNAMVDPSAPITELLKRSRGGDSDAQNALAEAVYQWLRQYAAGFMRKEKPGHVLQTTALAHEAYIRLISQAQIDWQDRVHFRRAVARAMRQILIDWARKGRDTLVVPFDEDVSADAGSHDGVRRKPRRLPRQFRSKGGFEYTVVDNALRRLEQLDPQQADIAVYKIFFGLHVNEIALQVDASPRTVDRKWRLARVWLARELGPTPDGET